MRTDPATTQQLNLSKKIQGLFIPLGSYHVSFFGHLTLGLGSYDHKVGYPKKGGEVCIWSPSGAFPICSLHFGGTSLKARGDL